MPEKVFEHLRARLVKRLAAFAADPVGYRRALASRIESGPCVFSGLNDSAPADLGE